MNETITKGIVTVCKQCFREQDLDVLGEHTEEDRTVFYARGRLDPIFSNISCMCDPSHELVELSMVSRDSFAEETMASLLELMNLINIGEITATWSITPYRNVELRSAIAVNPDTLDKAQLRESLKRFMGCATRVYPAIVDQTTGEKSPQDTMDQLVEQNRDFFI